MKNVIWKGPIRNIPKVCVAEPGDLISNLSDSKAKSFVDQGLAEYEKVKPEQPKKSEEA